MSRLTIDIENAIIRIGDYPDKLNKLIFSSLLGDNVWLCGGSVRDIINGDEPVDYDIFSTSFQHFDEFLRDLIYKAEANNYSLNTYQYEKLTSIKIKHKETNEEIKLQLVFMRYPESIDDCLNKFPFVINKFGFDGTYVYTTTKALSDNEFKMLNVNYVDEDNCLEVLWRIGKYCNKGLKFNPKGAETIAKAIRNASENQLQRSYDKCMRSFRSGMRGGSY